MNWRKLLAALLVLCMLFSFAACGEDEGYYDEEEEETEETEETEQTDPTDPSADPTDPTDPENDPGTNDPGTNDPIGPVVAPDTATPLLYKVTDQNGNVAWLFGSIHAGAEYFYPLPEYVTAAYEGADALAVEFDVKAYESDTTAQMALATKMLYTDGTTIKDHIPEETYNEAVKILQEKGIYMSYMAVWTDTINGFTEETAGVNYDLGIDMHLLDKAYSDNKKILDIESAEFQFGMLLGYSDELQTILLADAIASYYAPEEYKAELEDLMAIWATGNESQFAAYLDQEVTFETPEEKALYEEYTKAMETDRNICMADFVETALASGEEVFVCVGAAHVVGQDAMVELLRERGYTVTLVQQ